MLTANDEYTREALSVTVANTMGSSEVLEALYPLLLKRGTPEYLRSANGPELTSEPFKDRLAKVGIKPIRIYPGSPWENGYNERFNGTLRRELLNAEWFGTTRQAQTVINPCSNNITKSGHIRPCVCVLPHLKQS
jgi:putative transposase